MAITIIGVTNGRKYAVLKNSLPRILLLRQEARSNGKIIAITVVLNEKTNVFFNIKANSALVKRVL